MTTAPATGRALVVFGPEPPAALAASIGEVALEGVALRCAFAEVPTPSFDARATPRAVLLRKRGFSVNYRDRALALSVALRGPPGRFAALGSDFVAEVLAVGDAVTELSPGDRVIGNAAYPDSGEAGIRPGVPVNTASREYQVLPAAKLMRIPDAMTDAVAAGFTIGAQTAGSMIRRADPPPGGTVLLTAARSNTSLALLAALRGRGVRIHAVTGAGRDHDRLRALGAEEIVVPQRDPAGGGSRFQHDPAVRRVMEAGGYATVLDPFFDLHVAASLEVLGMGGTYVTCGIEDQHSSLLGRPGRPAGGQGGLFGHLLMKNLRILGNCIGQAEDLARAIEAHVAGGLPVVVDSEHRDTTQAAAFLHRSWLAPDRFGKVVFLYG